MVQRTILQTILEEIMGSRNVYFQPPEDFKMKYPCIVYERDSGDTQFADNIPYIFNQRYAVTLIDKNPDSKYLKKIAELPKCVYNRHYVQDGLNHDIFNLYF